MPEMLRLRCRCSRNALKLDLLGFRFEGLKLRVYGVTDRGLWFRVQGLAFGGSLKSDSGLKKYWSGRC